MTDSTRAASWAESTGRSIETLDHIAAYPQGTYGDSRTHGAWAGYQAARKAALAEAAQVCDEQAASPALAPIESYRARFIADTLRALADGATKEGAGD
jgi:hypothetical protein